MTIDDLRTQDGDVELHRTRRMFCIRNGTLVVAPEATTTSHLEWFEAEGWITKNDAQEFMESTIRGVFLPAKRALFFYKGVGFFFDTAVKEEALCMAEAIGTALTLGRDVEVYVGPPDTLIHGTRYRQERLGTIESLTAARMSRR